MGRSRQEMGLFLWSAGLRPHTGLSRATPFGGSLGSGAFDAGCGDLRRLCLWWGRDCLTAIGGMIFRVLLWICLPIWDFWGPETNLIIITRLLLICRFL